MSFPLQGLENFLWDFWWKTVKIQPWWLQIIKTIFWFEATLIIVYSTSQFNVINKAQRDKKNIFRMFFEKKDYLDIFLSILWIFFDNFFGFSLLHENEQRNKIWLRAVLSWIYSLIIWSYQGCILTIIKNFKLCFT
jgi:hypothetical protein